tara:strand:+ start:688 stop:1221 length:534 start_codon:yes stop_codon:yes gene_type:complete
LKSNPYQDNQLTDEQWDTLVSYAFWWAGNKLKNFKHWGLHELANEVILAFFKIKHRYDSSRGGITTFLNAHIYDPVFRSYAKQREIKISRPGSSLKKEQRPREYTDRTVPLIYEGFEIEYVEEQKEEVEVPLLPEGYEDIIELLKRGLTQRQIGFALGVTEGRISQRMRQLRKELAD